MTTIGERITAIIKANGMTQRQFAERINVSEAAVSIMCAGKSNPGKQSIGLICDKFNVNRDWLLTGEGEMFRPRTSKEVLTDFLSDLLKDNEDSYRRRLVEAMADWKDEDWEEMAALARRLNLK